MEESVINGPRTVEFKAFYWSYEERSDHEDVDTLTIHIGGRTVDGQSVHCKVEGFPPFVYLQLPKTISWNKMKCSILFEYFQKVMKSNGPTAYSLEQKLNLYGLEELNTMCLSFPTNKAIKAFFSKCRSRNGVVIQGVGSFGPGDLEVHLHNIDPIIKFTASKMIKLAGFVSASETIPEDEFDLSPEDRKYSTADIDLVCNWEDVNAYEPVNALSAIVDVVMFTFDIECYSKNHNSKIPDPATPENEIFSISIVLTKYNSKIRQKVLLTLKNPLDIEGVNVIRYASERDLILGFKKWVIDTNPDALVTFNGMKFDWNYLIERANLLGIYNNFSQMTRIIRDKAEVKTAKWNSSAYGDQEFKYLDPTGRSNVDVLIEVERNYKLPTYTLDAVSEFFLKTRKDDITHRQLFMLYQITDEMEDEINELEDGLIPRERRIELKTKVQNYLVRRRCHGKVLELRTKFMNAKTGKEFKRLIREPLTLTGFYNVQDSILTTDLCEKLNLWTTMESMSNIMNVPMSYLHTRGQQIKVLSQVYRETIFEDIIIPYKAKPKDEDVVKYQGAVVIEANPGDYDNVVCFDFESLYPSVMIAFNICYSTLIKDDDPIPDEECHVLDWGDHVACIKAGTGISTVNRTVPIEGLIKYRDKLMGYNFDKNGIGRYSQTNFFNRNVKECIRLTFEDGSILECTPDHRILSSAESWIQAGDLVIGDKVKAGYIPPSFTMGDESFELAGTVFTGNKLCKLMNILGLLWSDGHIAKREGNGGGRTVLYVGHQLDLDSTVQDARSLFGNEISIKKENYCWGITILGKYDKAIRLLEGAMINGKQPQLRTLPSFLKTAGRGVLASFLSGLFGGDGHTFTYSHKAHSFGSLGFSWSSTKMEYLEPVFKELKEYLSKFDITSNYKIRPSKNNKYECKLTIEVTDNEKFRKQIGFAHCVHKSVRLDVGCRYLAHRQKVWDEQTALIERYKENKKDNTNAKALENAIKGNGYIYNEYYANPTLSQMTDLSRLRRKNTKPMFSSKHFPGPMEFVKMIGAEDVFNGYGVKGDVVPTYNISVVGSESIGEHQVYDLEVQDSHTFLANGIVVHNCEHDPKRRKKKKEDVLCMHHRYRFRKVVTLPDGTRLYEGIMPKLERKLLSNRKLVKKDMAKLESKLKMAMGTASDDDIEYYKKMGWEIVEKGSMDEKALTVLKVGIMMLNANQLGLKIAANSAYGGMGAQQGFIPLVEGAASVTAKGRELIMDAIRYILEKYPDIAKLVYGDTDSSMITFIGKTTEESFALGDIISRQVSHYLKTKLIGLAEDYSIKNPVDGKMYTIDKYPRKDMEKLKDEYKIKIHEYDANPVNLQFENLYKRYLLLSKKRYLARATNREGKITAKIKKGVVLARRDNCMYLKDTYDALIEAIMDKSPENKVMYILYDQVQKLFTRQVPDANLIKYTGVKTIMNYAKRKETKQGKTVTHRVFIDENNEEIVDPSGPMDPRLVYPNLPQVILAMRMMVRGDDVPPNTRLEYILLEKDDVDHQGEQLEDYTFYRENKNIPFMDQGTGNVLFSTGKKTPPRVFGKPRKVECLRPDYLAYIDKQLLNPLEELLQVKFPKEYIPFEKLEDAFNRCIETLNDLLRYKIKSVKTYTKKVKDPNPRSGEYTVGWGAICEDCISLKSATCPVHSVPRTKALKQREYTYKGIQAQIQYILDSVQLKKYNPKIKNEVDPVTNTELIKVCLTLKSKAILDKIHTSWGIPKRKSKKPTQTGEKLPVMTANEFNNAFFSKKFGKYERGTMVTLKVLTSTEDPTYSTAKKKKYKHTYVVEIKNTKEIVKEVPRDYLTSYRIRDSTIVTDILNYRTGYKLLIKHLKYCLSPYNIDGYETELIKKRKKNVIEIEDELEEE